MSYTPTDVANESLDAIGSEVTIGDIEEGSREAKVLIRHYWTCLRQLLRGAHWDYARKTAPLTLLADATGQTPGVGTIVPIPYKYEYAYPTDCAKARFIPWVPQGITSPAGNISLPSQPIMTGVTVSSNQLFLNQGLQPAKFILAADYNYPPQPGSELWAIPGVGNSGRTVVLTNVQNAQMIYTEIVLEPQRWDDLFRSAMVSYLASEVALAIHKDKKLGIELRNQQIAITKSKLDMARVANGNEGWAQADIKVDWMRERRTFGSGWGNNNWAGPWGADGYYGWDMVGFGDGSSY
jgi:hypothetical protein